eukprot:GEMP01096308.1.p1 GENE.GEMP01096308.1~~GEMP01096308.1.p1  ORF type:complete len:227 (+),score=21.32 GEMP01096308.1:148-828(+)
MRESSKSGLHLTPEAQNRLNDAVRNRQLGEGELEPVVLQQLASYPEEVQKNVIDRFLTTGLTSDVQNKTGWLVGILKRELKAYQEAIRFRGLDPSVSKKLENALRTRRLRPEEFPSDIIGILTNCVLHEQQVVVDKFLQKHNTNTPQICACQNQYEARASRNTYECPQMHLCGVGSMRFLYFLAQKKKRPTKISKITNAGVKLLFAACSDILNEAICSPDPFTHQL